MSIFSKFKNLFNKNIECGDELTGHMVYLFPLKNRVVNIDSHIIVNVGFNVVFVCNDKVCDVLPSGKHKISGVTLPVSFSKLKLDRPNKHGNFPKKFKADVYYVNTQIFNRINFVSDNPFFLKSTKFGRIKGLSEGLADVQIADSEKLMKALLLDRPFVVTKEAPKLIYTMIGNVVNRMLEHTKLGFSEIILNPKSLNDYFNPDINTKTEDIGLRVFNLEVTSLKLNKKLQSKISEFLTERKHYEQQFDSTGIKYSPQNMVPDKVEINSSYKDSVITNNESNIPQNNNIQPEIVRRGSSVSLDENEYSNKKYETSELNASKELFNAENKKVCKFCGETISIDYIFCPKCGFKQ